MAVTVQPYQIIFAATLTQFNTMLSATLPGAGATVSVQGPNKFAGTINGTSSSFAGKGQADFSYDGMNFVRFFGANITLAMINQLIASLAGTLGAPVPPNQAVPQNYVS